MVTGFVVFGANHNSTLCDGAEALSVKTRIPP